jgi:murein DD-endopeptidase MepM/ murein hydrolase activator NlpD
VIAQEAFPWSRAVNEIWQNLPWQRVTVYIERRLNNKAVTGHVMAFCQLLLLTAAADAHTHLVVHRQSLENAVSIETEMFGPVQVQLRHRRSSILLDERILDGPGVFTLSGLPSDSLSDLELQAVPGRPSASRLYDYRKPFSDLADWQISQSFHGSASHDEALNAYAVDFALLMGTPVRAARTGVVMEIIDDHPDQGSQQHSALDHANLVRILHADGSMAVYGHLLQDSVTVKPGQWLPAGTVIAQSGNSGYSYGPHLHFVVQINTGMQLQSIPFRMRAADGSILLEP